MFQAPEGYPEGHPEGRLAWTESGQADFVHIFVQSRQQFLDDFAAAAAASKPDGLFWVSYPKAKGKQTYDINRDILWDLLLPAGYHPVSQVALDDSWSAVRIKRNEPGVDYERPHNVQRP